MFAPYPAIESRRDAVSVVVGLLAIIIALILFDIPDGWISMVIVGVPAGLLMLAVWHTLPRIGPDE